MAGNVSEEQAARRLAISSKFGTVTLFIVLHRSDRRNVKFYEYNMAASAIFGKS